MFNDESTVSFNMEDISTVDGFVEITEIMAEMLKYLANEPSVGLFYVQQHTHSTVPNLVALRNNVEAKSREMALHTEDLGDSIATLSSMKECGYLIVDEMIEDIKNSLNIISTKKPKRGLINNSSSLFQLGRSTSSWGPSAWGRNEVPLEQEAESSSSSSYISTVFKSAKERASSMKWVQSDSVGSAHTESGNLPSILDPSLQAAVPSTSLAMSAVQMPSGKVHNGLQVESQTNEDLSTNQLCLSESFDEFKAERDARLEKWLEQMNDEADQLVKTNAEKL